MALIGISHSCTQINNYITFLSNYNLDMQSPLNSLEQKVKAFTKVDNRHLKLIFILSIVTVSTKLCINRVFKEDLLNEWLFMTSLKFPYYCLFFENKMQDLGLSFDQPNKS